MIVKFLFVEWIISYKCRFFHLILLWYAVQFFSKGRLWKMISFEFFFKKGITKPRNRPDFGFFRSDIFFGAQRWLSGSTDLIPVTFGLWGPKIKYVHLRLRILWSGVSLDTRCRLTYEQFAQTNVTRWLRKNNSRRMCWKIS